MARPHQLPRASPQRPGAPCSRGIRSLWLSPCRKQKLQSSSPRLLQIPGRPALTCLTNLHQDARRWKPWNDRFRGNDCDFERPSLANDTSAHRKLLLTFAFYSPTIEAIERTRRRAQLRRSVASGDWGKDWTWSLPMAEGGLLSLQPAADTRATQTVPIGGVNPPLHGDVKSPLQGEAKSPPHRPWTLPPQGLAIFHGDKGTARLSHYFLPRLLLQGKRVLMLDGANCADPRLLERLARQRRVPFEQFSRQIQIARAFTCFQLTELIARVPRLLTDFPAELLIVTAFPELYYDEDVRDWNARVAFEQALANLQRWARSGVPASAGSPCKEEAATGVSGLASHASAQGGSVRQLTGKPLAF